MLHGLSAVGGWYQVALHPKLCFSLFWLRYMHWSSPILRLRRHDEEILASEGCWLPACSIAVTVVIVLGVQVCTFDASSRYILLTVITFSSSCTGCLLALPTRPLDTCHPGVTLASRARPQRDCLRRIGKGQLEGQLICNAIQ